MMPLFVGLLAGLFLGLVVARARDAYWAAEGKRVVARLLELHRDRDDGGEWLS